MKTWQMIKELQENPKARFKNNRCEDNVSVHRDGFLTWDKKGTHYEMTFAGFSDCCSGNSDDDWEKVPEPVDFMTAVNSGRRIRNEIWEGYYFFHEALHILQNYGAALDLINGKWYVE